MSGSDYEWLTRCDGCLIPLKSLRPSASWGGVLGSRLLGTPGSVPLPWEHSHQKDGPSPGWWVILSTTRVTWSQLVIYTVFKDKCISFCWNCKLFTLHCEGVVFLCLALTVLGHTGVSPSMRQSEGTQLQPVPSDGPLPLQTALCTANTFTFIQQLSLMLSQLPLSLPSSYQ